MVSIEEILLETHKPLGTKAEESNTAGDSLTQIAKGGGVLMVCRTCGKKGDHWTSRCPFKDPAPQSEVLMDRPASPDSTLASSVSNSTYVPPSKRAGAEKSTGSDIRLRNEENAVRVGNLSDDTTDLDLQELFRPFGPILCAHVAKDYKTGASRGYGFVNFLNREDAQRAIGKLNGYGYDNLILEVEWSAPRSK